MPNVTLPEDTMTLNHCFNVRSLVLAAAMVTSLGLVNHANAQLLPWRFGQLTVSEPRKQVKIEAVDIAQDPHAIGEPVGKREPKHVTLDLESTEIGPASRTGVRSNIGPSITRYPDRL